MASPLAHPRPRPISSHAAFLLCAALLAAAAAPVNAGSEGCTPDWIPTFGPTPGTNDLVNVVAMLDDGSGPALYVGGRFTGAGGTEANRVARWDGESWSALGSGMDNDVFAFAVFDDGSGPALYAGGKFQVAGGVTANGVAKWDGQAWSAVGSGMKGLGPGVGVVRALAAFDDGSGAALYAAGEFWKADGQPVHNIARWDGLGWSIVGSGLDPFGEAYALSVFDDGCGPALYVGGRFFTAGGVSATCIARWDGSWSSVGGGIGFPVATTAVRALAICDAGGGPALYAAGNFGQAGGLPAARVAKWDGASWSALGSGLTTTDLDAAQDIQVKSLAAFDDGSGSALYVGGYRMWADDQFLGSMARWDGKGWSTVGNGLNHDVNALTAFDPGGAGSPALAAAGSFTYSGSVSVPRVALWDGVDWGPVVPTNGVDDRALVLLASDDGASVCVGGFFGNAGGDSANGIAEWNGSAWTALGALEGSWTTHVGLKGSVRALTRCDVGLGVGPVLVAGGLFSPGPGPTGNVAWWNGLAWSPLGTGMNSKVNAFETFDDGSGAGPALYAAGQFTIPALGIARWDGQDWRDVGGGMTSPSFPSVNDLAVFDDGTGPALYAGGQFTEAGGKSARNLVKWDGQQWVEVGGGTNGAVQTLVVFDDGFNGPALYAGGWFTEAGGLDVQRVARWDGLSWSSIGSGMDDVVNVMKVLDDSSGPALYAGGAFAEADGTAAGRVARWDGQTWTGLQTGMNKAVFDLAVFEGPTGLMLVAAGSFDVSASGDAYLAVRSCASSGIDSLPGCFGNPAKLAPISSQLVVGATFEASISASAIQSGFGLLYVGFDGTDSANCGAFFPGIGELMLAPVPVPVQAAAAELSGGTAKLALPVPGSPGLVGLQVAFGGVAVGTLASGVAIELSNGLLATLVH